MRNEVRVSGLRELMRNLNRADKATKKKVRDRLRAVGEIVRRDSTGRFSSIDAKSAGGFRVAVRQRGVAVEQRLRKTTGKRGDFGALQMRRALIPAADENHAKVLAEMEQMLDELADMVG